MSADDGSEERKRPLSEFDEPTPREIVEDLDRFVIGQAGAKRAVAVALRNRTRRIHVDPEIADEIAPKNIIMIGPTGVGKTEIARRLARLYRSPFVKVEASKFTEVGYVGRDVESMVRDLVEVSVDLLREELAEEVREQVEVNAEERLLDLLLPSSASPSPGYAPDGRSLDEMDGDPAGEQPPAPDPGEAERTQRSRQKLRERLRAGELDDRRVEVSVREPQPAFLEAIGGTGEDLDLNTAEMLRSVFGGRYHKTEMFVPQALDYFVHEEEDRLVDRRQVSRLALERAEDQGIIFIDELDKVASSHDSHGPDVSREGVQRDLLPLLDGSSVTTRHGSFRTDHVLYIGAGAFQENRPSDLIPELQGRFPIRVELDPLSVDDFERILTEPESALLKQYEALLETEGLRVSFSPEGIREIAEVAARVNESAEDIGARRLHTILEKVLEDFLFDAPDLEQKEWTIGREYVSKRLEGIVEDEDLSRYIL